MSFLLRATRKLGEYLSKFNYSKTEITSSDFDNHLVFFLVSLKKWFLPNPLQRHQTTGCSKFIPPKYESLFHKSRKEIELPFSMKYSKLAVRISSIISKNKIQAKGFQMIQAAWKSIEAIQRYLQKR